MFILLRRMGTWLHQHVFKVGWLVTQNYQTTTILYYTFFLPGVFLHELTYWLAAGIFNVRAERAIKWPEKQEIGELKLTFVQIKSSSQARLYRRAVITVIPLIAGIIAVWLIADNIYDLQTVTNNMSSGNLTDIASALQDLLRAPNFWLWAYVIVTVGNTMFPQIPSDLKGWRTIGVMIAALALALTLIGLGGELFEALHAPLSSLISVLQSSLLLIIIIDFIVVLILGTIEYAIESATGRSATFRGGKMITMSREQALEEQKRQWEKDRRTAEQRRKAAVSEAIPHTIYALSFPLPGAPGSEPVTELHNIPESVKPAEDAAVVTPVFGGILSDKPEHAASAESEPAQPAAARLAPAPKPSASTPVHSSVHKSLEPDDAADIDDIEDDEPEDIEDEMEGTEVLRRGRGEDAVSGLFAGLSTDPDEETDLLSIPARDSHRLRSADDKISLNEFVDEEDIDDYEDESDTDEA